MNFFQGNCQTGPHTAASFGLCDDQNATVAYVDTATPAKWIAKVDNPDAKPVTFTAIDKCIILDEEEFGRGRCDAMLTTDKHLYLVELKDKRADWRRDAKDQLQSTIEFLKSSHSSADLKRFTHRKAFACNKQHAAFVVIDHEEQRNFFQTHGFRLDLQATIVIVD